MKRITSIIALFGLVASVVAAADQEPIAVEAVLVALNKPGTILVEISVGSDDGIKTGEILVVSRKDKRIGKLKVARVAPDRSTATITDVDNGETLHAGDRVMRPH
jgi:hypothetical protein